MSFLLRTEIEIFIGSVCLTYDAEVGLVEKVTVGFDPDHGIFGIKIDIRDFVHNYQKTTGWVCLDESAESVRFIKGVIDTIGGSYDDLESLKGKTAFLIRSDDSPTPIGIGSPSTGTYILYKDFFKEVPF